MITDPIPEDQVFERLRVALEVDGLALQRGTLDGASTDERGRFFTTAAANPDDVRDRHVDLQRWARQRGVLKANESMVPSHGEVRE